MYVDVIVTSSCLDLTVVTLGSIISEEPYYQSILGGVSKLQTGTKYGTRNSIKMAAHPIAQASADA